MTYTNLQGYWAEIELTILRLGIGLGIKIAYTSQAAK